MRYFALRFAFNIFAWSYNQKVMSESKAKTSYLKRKSGASTKNYMYPAN